MMDEQRIYAADRGALIRLNEVDPHDTARIPEDPTQPADRQPLLDLMVDEGATTTDCASLRLDLDGVRKLRLLLQRLERSWARGHALPYANQKGKQS